MHAAGHGLRSLFFFFLFPENTSRAIPNWVFPNGTGSSARHQSRPDAIFVCSIPGRQTYVDPSKIPPQDRDIHLVKLKFCPDTNPFITLEMQQLNMLTL
eukprot:1160931-Pelagomonas_calceolata.AAC.1